MKEKILLNKILKRIPNRFLLSLAVAKRARQIKEGAKPLVEIPENETAHPILTALEEIYQEKIDITIEEDKDENLELIEEGDRNIKDLESQIAEEETDTKKSKKETKTKHKSKTLTA